MELISLIVMFVIILTVSIYSLTEVKKKVEKPERKKEVLKIVLKTIIILVLFYNFGIEILTKLVRIVKGFNNLDYYYIIGGAFNSEVNFLIPLTIAYSIKFIMFILIILTIAIKFKRKKLLVIPLIIIFILINCGADYYIEQFTENNEIVYYETVLDTEYKYKITTSEKILTAAGFSYSNSYYEIDLLNKTIEQKRDEVNKIVYSYDALGRICVNDGDRETLYKDSYYGKVVMSGVLTDSQVEKLEELFINRINLGDYEVDGVITLINPNIYYISSIDVESIRMSIDETEEFLEIVSEVFGEEESLENNK